MYSTIGYKKSGRLIALFSFFGSTQIVRLSFDFSSRTKLFTQSVGSCTCVIIFFSTVFHLFFNFCRRECGIHLGGITVGEIVLPIYGDMVFSW